MKKNEAPMAVGQNKWYHFWGPGAPPIVGYPFFVVGLGSLLGANGAFDPWPDGT